MRQLPHLFDVISLFFLRHHDVHDLQLALGFFCCSNFNIEIPSVGRTFTRYRSASVYFVSTSTISSETDSMSLLCHGFDQHQQYSHLCLSRFNGHWFAFCILGHKQTSTFIPRNRLANCRYSTFQRPSDTCILAGCTTVLHAAVSTPNVISLYILSDLIPCCDSSTCYTSV